MRSWSDSPARRAIVGAHPAPRSDRCGKSLLARRTYELKKTRRLVKGRLVEVNCAIAEVIGTFRSWVGRTEGMSLSDLIGDAALGLAKRLMDVGECTSLYCWATR